MLGEMNPGTPPCGCEHKKVFASWLIFSCEHKCLVLYQSSAIYLTRHSRFLLCTTATCTIQHGGCFLALRLEAHKISILASITHGHAVYGEIIIGFNLSVSGFEPLVIATCSSLSWILQNIHKLNIFHKPGIVNFLKNSAYNYQNNSKSDPLYISHKALSRSGSQVCRWVVRIGPGSLTCSSVLHYYVCWCHSNSVPYEVRRKTLTTMKRACLDRHNVHEEGN